VINNHFFVTGSHSDNCLDLWIMNKKKPIFSLPNCHKPNTWMLSTANVKSSDLMVSGGVDGCINWYQFDKEKKQINKLRSLSGFEGCINSLKFSHTKGLETKESSIMLAVSHSQEERTGRWNVQGKAKTGITIVRKTTV
jgi:WD40 repeat protein